jgi:hypothetical protein
VSHSEEPTVCRSSTICLRPTKPVNSRKLIVTVARGLEFLTSEIRGLGPGGVRSVLARDTSEPTDNHENTTIAIVIAILLSDC